MVEVLTKGPSCVQCTATTRKLKALGVDFFETDLDETNLQRAKDLGHTSAPVVIAPNGEHWSGFDPGRLEQLAA